MLNTQAVFNQVCAALIAQGRPSKLINGVCLYRGPDGIKCAVGYLIPDSMLGDDFNQSSVYHLPREVQEYLTETVMGATSVKEIDEASYRLGQLQTVHDTEGRIAPTWVDGFKIGLASSHGRSS